MKKEIKKIIYLGSGIFAASLLKPLKKELSDLTIVTQKYKNNPVEQLSSKIGLNLELIQGKEDLLSLVKKIKPGYIIVADFGIILPQEIFEQTKLIINVHPSLLPKYRGPSPYVSALLNGETKTGVSIIKMVNEVDAGPIYIKKALSIEKKDDSITLQKKLSNLSGKLIHKYLNKIIAGKIVTTKQDDKLATFTKMLKKSDGKLNLMESAETIERKIRAFYPWPSVYFLAIVNDKKMNIKILKATVAREESLDSLCLKTKNGFLKILELQPEGKKPMTAQDFLKGYNIKKIL